VVVSVPELAMAASPPQAGLAGFRAFDRMLNLEMARNMDRASSDGMPHDVLVVEDDPIIALDFEDTILGFGVKTVRSAANVAKALDMIADRPPQFALLDVSLIREKSFAVAERLEALKIPFAFVTGYGADARLPAAFATKPRLPKPYSTDALQALLKNGCSRP
jgi:CheY-like chemotaxis protein